MRLLPTNLVHQLDALLEIDARDKAAYLEWLRFYWDFCHKYYYDPYRTESLSPFLDRLREKWQSDHQRNQAWQAMTWFYRLQPILDANSSVLAFSENLGDAIRNPNAALKSVVLPSNTIAENATTSTARPPIPTQRDSKRPSQPASYNQ